MAMWRPRSEDDDEGGGADEQQRRHGSHSRRIRPALSFRAVVRRALAAETIQQIVLNLEPVIRRVVREEIQNIFPQQDRTLIRSLPLRIQEVEISPPLKLIFARSLMQPIFTNNKLACDTNNPIEIHLIDTRINHLVTQPSTLLGFPIRLEVMVLDGEFRCEDGEGWTTDQFKAATVRAREGKRPLLVGTLNVAMNNHGVAVIDDVSFTDNSSWIRCRKFRIGVRVITPPSYFGVRIQEAVSESFTVKDHRGESYKKHYPPSLTDNIWRLKNIGKEGPIDKRLESEGIITVQDFLRLNIVNPSKLKELVGMSEKQWSTTLDHAKTCMMGAKCHVFKTEGCDITFSPVGEILTAKIGDQSCPFNELHPQQKVNVRQLATQAYQQWDQLEEVANEMPVSANEPLMIRTSNSGWEQSESQESMISAGSQNVRYLDSIGTPTSSAAAAMATNSSLTSDATAAVSANHDMFWSPSPAAPGDHFGWQNSSNDLGCWDQVD